MKDSPPFRVVIPARYASERLPGKPLVELAGRPLIEHVYRRAVESGAGEVLVATDDARIAAACEAFGATAVMTGSQHASGTDRIAEVAALRGWDDDAVVVNLQGDEPLMPPELIARTAAALRAGAADVATLAAPIGDAAEFSNPNAVKVVCDARGRALYFSRAAIPARRTEVTEAPLGLRHIGLYVYRVGALRTLAATPPCALEQIEKLEQLRALWLGMSIAVEVVEAAPPGGVDTPEDAVRVAPLLASSAQGRRPIPL